MCTGRSDPASLCILDDQATFDGLWLFTEDHFNSNGLMNWYIGNYGEPLGTGAATDAEVDMAYALINACVKVNEGVCSASTYSIDYCQEATDMINAIWQHEVDAPGSGSNGLANNQGYELLPGDSWGYMCQQVSRCHVPSHPQAEENAPHRVTD